MTGDRVETPEEQEQLARVREVKRRSYHKNKHKYKQKRLRKLGKGEENQEKRKEAQEEAEILSQLESTSTPPFQQSPSHLTPYSPLPPSSLPPFLPSSPITLYLPLVTRQSAEQCISHQISKPTSAKSVTHGGLELVGVSRGSPCMEDRMDREDCDSTYQPSESDSDMLSDTASDTSHGSSVPDFISDFWTDFDTAVDDWMKMTGGLDYFKWLASSADLNAEICSQRRAVQHLLTD
ncbi:hypothetical protein M422DRAFT_43547 [Sphaerobolus stellatus SS14]|nr:hypothetical protein M422DRAFT_43547 [Sphaerobolus stellatus SS14]